MSITRPQRPLWVFRLAHFGANSKLKGDTSVSQVSLHETAPTQFQDIGDVNLAYRRFGKEGAPPLVCLQHFTGTMDNWDPIHTNRLAKERAVILVDYRGVGRSGGEAPSSIAGMARDIIAFIRALAVERVDLFGFSIGSMVAQQLAGRAPQPPQEQALTS
jgi:pimeloyl-ACP methyl ester carboxylesterase